MTVPVADATKVKKRKSALNASNHTRNTNPNNNNNSYSYNDSQSSPLYPEDDFNQSYVFDLEEGLPRGCTSPGGRSTNGNNMSMSMSMSSAVESSPRVKRKAKKSARDKKRELENKFGSNSATTHTTTTATANYSSQDSTMFHLSGSGDTFGNSQDFSEYSQDLGSVEGGEGANNKIRKGKKKKMRQNSHDNPTSEMFQGNGNSSSNTPPPRHPKNGLGDYLADEQTRNTGGMLGTLSKCRSKASMGDSRDGSDNRKKTVIKMRDTDRLIRPAMQPQRQDSGVFGGGGGGGGGGRPGLPRQDSVSSTASRPSLQRKDSKQKGPQFLQRKDSKRPPAAMKREDSKKVPALARRHSFTPNNNKIKDDRPPVRGRSMSTRPPQTTVPTTTTGMRRARSMSMDRTESSRRNDFEKKRSVFERSRSASRGPGKFSRANSVQSMISNATEIIQKGDKTVVVVPMTEDQAKKLGVGNGTFIDKRTGKKYHFEFEETPPKSLVLIWIITCAELGFDLGTTIIAFQNLLEKDDCCGERMDLGPIPLSVTAPFVFLILAELSFLVRAILLTLWPSLFTGVVTAEDLAIRQSRSCCMRYLCCCLKWNAKALLAVINFLVLLNPFFGCIIAWMLLYQSNKKESFIVLGLEGGAIILHFISVYIEGGMKTRGEFLCACIPLIPFVVSVTMILIYLKQGGVCYLVEEALFMFSGCEICEDGNAPLEGVCKAADGTNYTWGDSALFDFSNTDIKDVSNIITDLSKRVQQGTYCGNEHPEGPQVNFCFFSYD